MLAIPKQTWKGTAAKFHKRGGGGVGGELDIEAGLGIALGTNG